MMLSGQAAPVDYALMCAVCVAVVCACGSLGVFFPGIAVAGDQIGQAGFLDEEPRKVSRSSRHSSHVQTSWSEMCCKWPVLHHAV